LVVDESAGKVKGSGGLCIGRLLLDRIAMQDGLNAGQPTAEPTSGRVALGVDVENKLPMHF